MHCNANGHCWTIQIPLLVPNTKGWVELKTYFLLQKVVNNLQFDEHTNYPSFLETNYNKQLPLKLCFLVVAFWEGNQLHHNQHCSREGRMLTPVFSILVVEEPRGGELAKRWWGQQDCPAIKGSRGYKLQDAESINMFVGPTDFRDDNDGVRQQVMGRWR